MCEYVSTVTNVVGVLFRKASEKVQVKKEKECKRGIDLIVILK